MKINRKMTKKSSSQLNLGADKDRCREMRESGRPPGITPSSRTGVITAEGAHRHLQSSSPYATQPPPPPPSLAAVSRGDLHPIPAQCLLLLPFLSSRLLCSPQRHPRWALSASLSPAGREEAQGTGRRQGGACHGGVWIPPQVVP